MLMSQKERTRETGTKQIYTQNPASASHGPKPSLDDSRLYVDEAAASLDTRELKNSHLPLKKKKKKKTRKRKRNEDTKEVTI